MSLLVTEEVGSGQDSELGLVETDNPNYWDWYMTLVFSIINQLYRLKVLESTIKHDQ